MFKVKIWKKKKHHTFQLRITFRGVLIVRDEGEYHNMIALLKKHEFASGINWEDVEEPTTQHLYGNHNICEADAKSTRLSKKERKMVKWAAEEKKKEE